MKKMVRFLLAIAMLAPIAGIGCGPRRQVRVDVWGPGETTYYSRWETESHRNHVEWNSATNTIERHTGSGGITTTIRTPDRRKRTFS